MATKTALVINPDGSFERAVVSTTNLEQIKEIVSRNQSERCWLEHVTVLFMGKVCDAWVDEDGHRKQLDLNPKATAIYHAASRSHQGLSVYNDITSNPFPHITRSASPIAGIMVVYPRRGEFNQKNSSEPILDVRHT